MIGVADGAGVTSSSVSGVAEEEASWDPFLLTSAFGFRCSCSADRNRLYTILFSSTTGENK